jgi:hypothetical protein
MERHECYWLVRLTSVVWTGEHSLLSQAAAIVLGDVAAGAEVSKEVDSKPGVRTLVVELESAEVANIHGQAVVSVGA